MTKQEMIFRLAKQWTIYMIKRDDASRNWEDRELASRHIQNINMKITGLQESANMLGIETERIARITRGMFLDYDESELRNLSFDRFKKHTQAIGETI